MPEGISRPVDPGALSIPESEDTVITAFTSQFSLLGSPQGSGGQILVQGRLKDDP